MFHPRLFSRRDESICELTIQVEEWNYAPERLSPGACFLGELQKKKKKKSKMQNSSLTSSLPTRLPAPTKCDFSLSLRCCLGLGSPRAQRNGSSRSMSDLGLGKPGLLCFTSFQLMCSLSFDDGTEATNYSSITVLGMSSPVESEMFRTAWLLLWNLERLLISAPTSW